MTDRRACFDFDIAFANGGGLQGRDFRLDIAGDDIADGELAAAIIRDLNLLMVGEVRILNKRIITERHKRAADARPSGSDAERGAAATPGADAALVVDLSHIIESGMVTYRGLPAPLVCDHLSFEASHAHYAAGTEFSIARIEMVANTGTYLDTPYHRYRDGHDVSALPLDRVSNVPAVVVRVAGMAERGIDWTHFAATDVRDRAVLVHTGWSARWGTDAYFEGHPFLTEAAAAFLRDAGARLVGIDSLNIDDTTGGARPVHSVLLAAGIPIVEHLTNLEALPTSGFTFFAVPPKVRGMGTFPVRAHARLTRQRD